MDFMDEKIFKPTVSVIVPLKPGMEYVSVINSIKKVDCPSNKIKVIIVKGRKPSLQRNLGVGKDQGEIIYFFDNDCGFDKNIFRKVVEHYVNPDVVAGVSFCKKRMLQ